jgi:phenylalanyl-tRNA synthetase alpha subunit
VASETVVAVIQSRDKVAKELSALTKQLKIELKIHKKAAKDGSDKLRNLKDRMQRQMKGNEIEQYQLHLILTNKGWKYIEEKLEALKEAVLKARKDKSSCKGSLQKFKHVWGCPIESIIAQIEKILSKFGVTIEAYHGGDFNGV